MGSSARYRPGDEEVCLSDTRECPLNLHNECGAQGPVKDGKIVSDALHKLPDKRQASERVTPRSYKRK